MNCVLHYGLRQNELDKCPHLCGSSTPTFCTCSVWSYRVTTKVRNMMLDATAGHRSMWRNKNPPNTIFIDRELALYKPPDVFADFRFCPFRDNVFECVIFDPPYYIRNDNNWYFWNPDGKKIDKRTKDHPNPTKITHYGLYRSKKEVLTNLIGGSREFYRISKRLCFQWGEGVFSLWQVLPLFKPWKMIYKREIIKKRAGLKRKSSLFWVTFVRSID